MRVAFYRSTRPGFAGLFNVLVRWWEGGPYSHVELVLETLDEGTSVCWSSSAEDGGVRCKRILLDPSRWDVIDLGERFSCSSAMEWFETHHGRRYDYLGLLGHVWRRRDGSRRRFVCSEAVGAALGLEQAWRFGPNALAALLRSMGAPTTPHAIGLGAAAR